MKKTLVLGASLHGYRYAYKAIKRLAEKGIEVACLGKRDGDLDGIKIHTNKILFQDIDTVTIYLSKKNQIEYYQYIIDLAPRRVIFNPGAENGDLVEILKKNNILSVNACTLVLLSMNNY